jgi:DNA polymerase III delta prime subunit
MGNQQLIQALDKWLASWDAVHLYKTAEKPKFSTQSNAGARAALISGPPGIGKSTCASLIGRRYGYDVLELNASDNRAAKSLKETLAQVTGSGVLTFGAEDGSGASGGAAAASSSSAAAAPHKRRLIIMDEVDGMSSGDRGGNAELIKIIKATRTPIICICNDRQKPSVRSLANSCYDLKFMRPPKPAIIQRMMQIAAAEGLSVDAGAMDQLIESCGQDIRQVLNTLQMWAKSSKSITATDMNKRMGEVSGVSGGRKAGPRVWCWRLAPALLSAHVNTLVPADSTSPPPSISRASVACLPADEQGRRAAAGRFQRHAQAVHGGAHVQPGRTHGPLLRGLRLGAAAGAAGLRAGGGAAHRQRG